MENFCYWQENTPQTNIQIYEMQNKKICLLRLNEYKLMKELEVDKVGLLHNIDIFCPYNIKQAENCYDYKLIKDIK